MTGQVSVREPAQEPAEEGRGWLTPVDGFDLSALVDPQATDDPMRFTLDVARRAPAGPRGVGRRGDRRDGRRRAAGRPQARDGGAHAQRHSSPPCLWPVAPCVEALRTGSATPALAVRCLDDAGGLLAHGVVVLRCRAHGGRCPTVLGGGR